MRGNQWIELLLNVKANQLNFDLRNSKPAVIPMQKNKKNIGLINVKKRLQLLYPEKHSLEINSTEDIYEVRLTLALREEIIPEKTDMPSSKKLAYV